MIPILIVFGMLAGYWWRRALVGAAVGWPLILWVTGVMDLGFGMLGAALLAVVNTGVGVLINQGVRLVRRRR
ncbi:hypothetical protein AB0M02_25055 [Actinoplanes sp. NPDC051861]|uniref:hypothetical protein n=1 Tax=Actinoplanes sp. NPDC051861 TaxID=3155170 RepID=UPI0034191A18